MNAALTALHIINVAAAITLTIAAITATAWLAHTLLTPDPEPAPEPVTWDAHNSINRRPGRR